MKERPDFVRGFIAGLLRDPRGYLHARACQTSNVIHLRTGDPGFVSAHKPRHH